eukprot:6091258-Heterocapsa_arctica.AAC.1
MAGGPQDLPYQLPPAPRTPPAGISGTRQAADRPASPDSPDFTPGDLSRLGWDKPVIVQADEQPSEWERT